MKINELIHILHSLQEKHGDNDIIISVADYYTNQGRDADLNLDISGSIWFGVKTNPDTKTTRLTAVLLDQNGKKPKITFR